MNIVRATVLIDADRNRVFDLLIDTRRHKEFVYAYIDQYDGPEILSYGTHFHWRIRLYGRIWKAHSLVSAFERPEQYQEMINIPGFAKAILTKKLEDVSGKTRLTWIWEYTPVFGLPGAIIDKLIRGEKTSLQGLDYSLSKIKMIIEKQKPLVSR